MPTPSPIDSVQAIMNSYHDTDVDMPNFHAPTYTNITTSAQTVVKSSAGVLFAVSFNGTLVSAVRGYDNTVSGGSQLFTIPAGTAANVYRYGVKFSTGLVVSTGGAADNVTVIYL